MKVYILMKYKKGYGGVFKGKGKKVVQDFAKAQTYKKEANAKKAAGEEWQVASTWR